MFSDNTLAIDDAFNMQMVHAIVLKEKFTQNQNIIQIHLISSVEHKRRPWSIFMQTSLLSS